MNSKIKSLEELIEISNKEKIVLALGSFRLLHIGHIEHLKQAKANGTLIVAVTAETLIDKSTKSPLNDTSRLEIIASLEFVDYVILQKISAVDIIKKLKPNFYAKGIEYKNSTDVGDAILLEKEAVESYGGKMLYTDGIVYSSSSIINSLNLCDFPKKTQEFLEQFRKKYSFNQIEALINDISNLEITILGEAIIDEYAFTSSLEKSAKEPLVAMQYKFSNLYLGGSLAIANHLSEFCKNINLITYLGDYDSHENFIKSNLPNNINLLKITKNNSPTILKQRFIDEYYMTKLFEVYKINQEQLNEKEELELINILKNNTKDCLLISDFGHGLIKESYLNKLKAYKCLNVQSNAGNLGFNFLSKYKFANFVCIDERELKLQGRDRYCHIENLLKQEHERINCDCIVVTRGKSGSIIYDGSCYTEVPSLNSEIIDRLGGGDTYFAFASVLSYLGCNPEIVSFIGNIAAGIKCKTLANSKNISKNDLLKTIKYLLK